MAEFDRWLGNNQVSKFVFHNLTHAAISATLSMFVIEGTLFTVRLKFCVASGPEAL